MLFSDVYLMAEEKLFKRKQYRMRYAGAGGGGCTITLPFDPRKGICAACGKSRHKIINGEPEIKLTALHHWKYSHSPETVKKNPILILDNTVEVCFACHQVADGLRGIMKMTDPERALAVMVKMPKDLLSKFAIICKLYLEWYNKQ
jgi:hypothetical protein